MGGSGIEPLRRITVPEVGYLLHDVSGAGTGGTVMIIRGTRLDLLLVLCARVSSRVTSLAQSICYWPEEGLWPHPVR